MKIFPRKIFLLFFSTHFSCILLSQAKVDFDTLNKDDSLQYVKYLKKVEVRKKGESFYRNTLFVHPLTTISGFTKTDFIVNSDPALQKKPLVLNADINFPIGIGGKGWAIGKFLHNSIHFVPRFNIRILRNDPSQGDSSMPVRTPSYMPGIKYLFTLNPLVDIITRRRKKSMSFLEDHSSLWGFINFFHHSNGQDDSTFRADGTINTHTGNFGEDLVFEFGIQGLTQFEKINKVAEEIIQSKLSEKWKDGKQRNCKKTYRAGRKKFMHLGATHDLFYKISYEYHPKNLSTFTRTRDNIYADVNGIGDIYGRKRLNFSLGWALLGNYKTFLWDGQKFVEEETSKKKKIREAEVIRVYINSSIILDKNLKQGDLNGFSKAHFKKRFNVSATGAWRLTGNRFAALFVQVNYFGSDPYNVYFQETIWQFKAGLAFGFLKFK